MLWASSRPDLDVADARGRTERGRFNTVVASTAEKEVTLSRTLELGRYVIERDQEQPFLAKREAMVEAAKENFPGLIEVTLAKLDDGSYVDAWIWEDRSFCEAAMAKVEAVPAIADWLQHIGEDVSMEFGTVFDADQR
jgi:hypothetical protein